jgi:transmembrane sensor
MNMASSNSFDPTIDREAAEWFGRREGGLTAAQEQEFQRWLAADARHAAHYHQFHETWSLLAEVEDRIPIPAGVASDWVRRARRFSRILSPALAAAAVFALGVFVWQRPPADTVRYSVATEIAGMKKIELPDGSIIRLNGDSAVAIDFTRSERRVALQRGEAHFTVAKSPSRPFVVSVAGLSVRAVGTAFNVALNSAQGGLEVLVTEGQVSVVEATKRQSVLPSPTNTHPVVTAGEKAVVKIGSSLLEAPVATVFRVPTAEIEQALAWQNKPLEFDDKPLFDVIAEFNRYNHHQIVIHDPALGRRTFGGVFRADNYEDLVLLLENRFDVVAKRSGNTTVLRLRR